MRPRAAPRRAAAPRRGRDRARRLLQLDRPWRCEAAVVALGLVPGLPPDRRARRHARARRRAGPGCTARPAGGSPAASTSWSASGRSPTRSSLARARPGSPRTALVHFADAASAQRGGREPGDAGRRGAGEGLARHAARAGDRRARGALRGSGALMLYHLLYALRGEVGALNVIALHHVPHRGREPHRAVPGAGARPVDDRAPAPAADRPVHPRRGAGGAQGQGRHAHDGRRPDPDRRARADAAVGGPHQPERLDPDPVDGRLRQPSASPTTTSRSSRSAAWA